jgi:hypothetical protein
VPRACGGVCLAYVVCEFRYYNLNLYLDDDATIIFIKKHTPFF